MVESPKSDLAHLEERKVMKCGGREGSSKTAQQ